MYTLHYSTLSNPQVRLSRTFSSLELMARFMERNARRILLRSTPEEV